MEERWADLEELAEEDEQFHVMGHGEARTYPKTLVEVEQAIAWLTEYADENYDL